MQIPVHYPKLARATYLAAVILAMAGWIGFLGWGASKLTF
jgi:hypothetical protein